MFGEFRLLIFFLGVFYGYDLKEVAEVRPPPLNAFYALQLAAVVGVVGFNPLSITVFPFAKL